MNWSDYLCEDETLRWEGRPAPRCYTFRNWLHSLFGVVILIAAVGWVFFGFHLGEERQNILFALLPIPFLLAGIYLAFGHLLLARLEWEHVYYALTDQRLFVVRGILSRKVKSLAVEDIIWFELRPLGEHLATIRVRCRDLEKKLAVTCVEQPQKLTTLLEDVLTENGIDITTELE